MSRSYLFIPGNAPAMIQNLDVFESDAIIIDLEDSVLDNDKDAARILVSNFIAAFQFKSLKLFVRVNDATSSYFEDDIRSLDSLDFNGYVLPKASPQSIVKLESLSNKDIIAIIETPMSVLQSEQIAAFNNVKGILLGAEDLTKELGVPRTLKAKEILFARSKIVLTCSAFQIDSIDTPFTGKADLDELTYDINEAKSLGFTSKSAIHPNHVELINKAFSPSDDEINQAKRIVIKAEKLNKGAFSLDGKMIDLPVIERAKNILEKAKKYNLL